MNKDEATVELLESRAKQLSLMCPVFRKECLGTKCASYYEGRVWGRDEKYRYSSAGCTSSLITGVMEVENCS